jgi:hypothetical protein
MVEPRRSDQPATTNLVDILDRVLDKGLVVAGDIRVSLANVELLTVRIRLLVCSIDKAQEIGLDWWRHDRFFSSGEGQLSEYTAALEARIAALEQRLVAAPVPPESTGPRPGRRSQRESGR